MQRIIWRCQLVQRTGTAVWLPCYILGTFALCPGLKHLWMSHSLSSGFLKAFDPQNNLWESSQMLNYKIPFEIENNWIGTKQILCFQPDFFILTHWVKFHADLEQADAIDCPVQTLLEGAFHLSIPPSPAQQSGLPLCTCHREDQRRCTLMLHIPRSSNRCSLEIPIKDTLPQRDLLGQLLWNHLDFGSISVTQQATYSQASTEFPIQTHRLCQPARSTRDFFIFFLVICTGRDSSKGSQALRGLNPAVSNGVVLTCPYFSLKAQLQNQVIKLMCICWLYLSTCNTCIGYDKPIRLFWDLIPSVEEISGSPAGSSLSVPQWISHFTVRYSQLPFQFQNGKEN